MPCLGNNGDFKILFSNFVPGCSSRNHAHFWLGSVPMAAWGSGVVRGYPELPGPRPDVLILFPGSIGPSHAEVLVVEEISHHFPNDPGIHCDCQLLCISTCKYVLGTGMAGQIFFYLFLFLHDFSCFRFTFIKF